ncbi:MAG: ChaN family lipoprotein [Spartobacteria bacterium]
MKWCLVLLAAALTSGCGSLGKPPLPKFAVGAAPPPAAETTARAATLLRADVIYFGLTNRSAVNSRPAWRIVETLQSGGAQVALGWADLAAEQQPLFDQWQRQEISAAQLLEELAAPERGDWLRRALRPDLLQVALGSPKNLLRKIRAGEELSAEERALLPQGYQPRPEAFDDFADRVALSPRLRRYDVARLYRAHLAAEQMIAENIVRFAGEHPGAKLLVFLPDDTMINPREVADFAGQKMKLRQMILDRATATPETRPQLLADRRRRLLEIVNRAPEPRRHNRRLPFPRLGA